MFDKILIANRGEIALRVQRACRELGIRTVAVHSTADAEAMHVRLADESVCIGPPAARDSYLNIPAILTAAAITGADAIHPGYGFLSENAGFAEMVEAHGLTFIGPSPDHIRMMGDKITAKAAMAGLGVPLVPGSDGALPDLDTARGGAPDRLPGADQGGRRRRRARHEGGADRRRAGGGLARRPHRGQAAFGNDEVYLEKYLDRPRHIELQVLADNTATSYISASATARCSAATRSCWRRPARPALTPAQRDAIGATATAALTQLGYRNAGTLEFLYQDGQFAFIEMNTRLQVEHPVTEMVCNVDLVREQIRIAAGQPLGYTQAAGALRGPRHRVPHQRRGPGDLHADAGPGHGVPSAGRARRARRQRALCRLRGAALLRQHGRQADRARTDAARGDRPHAPRAGRVRGRSASRRRSRCTSASWTTPASAPATTRSTGSRISSRNRTDREIAVIVSYAHAMIMCLRRRPPSCPSVCPLRSAIV